MFCLCEFGGLVWSVWCWVGLFGGLVWWVCLVTGACLVGLFGVWCLFGESVWCLVSLWCVCLVGLLDGLVWWVSWVGLLCGLVRVFVYTVALSH